jgi:hypothetical protein
MTRLLPGPPLSAPVIPRPCFFCGKMMTVIRPVRQLQCIECDVVEAGFLAPFEVMQGTECTWNGTMVTYVDHGEVHEPTP